MNYREWKAVDASFADCRTLGAGHGVSYLLCILWYQISKSLKTILRSLIKYLRLYPLKSVRFVRWILRKVKFITTDRT